MSDVRNDSDAELLEGCIGGDPDCWQELVRRYASLVYAIPRRLGLAEHDCDDIFQTVFAILMNRMNSIRDVQALPKWLMVTTKRECWRTMRRSPQESPAGDALESLTTANGTDELERHAALRRALDQLGPRCRDLLTLLFMSDGRPDYDSISAGLDMPVGSIGPTRARCLQRLITELRELPDAMALFPQLDPSGEAST